MNINNNNIDSSISSNLSDGGDEGYPSPDDDITKAGTEMRQRLREDRRLKRKRMEAAAAAVLNDGGEIVANAEELGGIWSEMVLGKFNTRAKITAGLLKSKIPKYDMQRWLGMVSDSLKAIDSDDFFEGGGEVAKKRKSYGVSGGGEYELMRLDIFNDFLGSQFPRFTVEEYVVNVGELLDKKSFFSKSRFDTDLANIYVKREREARLSEKWEDYRIAKIEDAAKRGRIAEKSVFRALNKAVCQRHFLMMDEAWNLYKKNWCLLMGLKPCANVDRFFRRDKPSAAASAASSPGSVVMVGDNNNDDDDDLGALLNDVPDYEEDTSATENDP